MSLQALDPAVAAANLCGARISPAGRAGLLAAAALSNSPASRSCAALRPLAGSRWRRRLCGLVPRDIAGTAPRHPHKHARAAAHTPAGGPPAPIPTARPAEGRRAGDPSPLPVSRKVGSQRRPTLLGKTIEHRLRAADQLIGLAHPVIKIAELEFLALERRQPQRLQHGRRRYPAHQHPQPRIGPARPAPATPQRAAR